MIRTDSNNGWGQNLRVLYHNIVQNKNNHEINYNDYKEIIIGPSEEFIKIINM